MLAVQVELLTGRYVASQFNDRNRAEWPPHPSRLFSAAVAAWAEADVPDVRERAALHWWEEQGEPSVACSWGQDGFSERAAVVHYVPVNDTQVVGRDLSTTYLRLRAAIDAVDAAQAGDLKASAKAEQAVIKMVAKAKDDSRKASTVGRAPTSALGLLPDQRLRHARVYPTVIPVDDHVVYRWPDANEDSPHVQVLDGVLARIARLGHSSSFVAVSVADVESSSTLVPNERGNIGLRVASPGHLDALEAAFAFHQGTEPRILPAVVAGYREAGTVEAVAPAPVFGRDWLVLELGDGARFTIRDTLPLARAVRGALLHHADQNPVPEIISGHVPGTDKATPPTTRAHLAVIPLPFVGHAHADGRVRAVALVFPTDLAVGERDQAEGAVNRWLSDRGRLNFASRPSVEVTWVSVVDAATSARPKWWCGPSQRWLSVTPIALDRNPGNLRHADTARREVAEQSARAIITAACVNIGLPPPVRVEIQTDPLLKGSASTRSFAKYAVQGGRVQRLLIHAVLEFGEPVFGPMLLGAGRYQGYGLCFPAGRREVGVASRD